MIKKILFTLFLGFVQTVVLSQKNIYTGSNGGWNTASNWSLASVPTASHDVEIPSGKSVNISANSFAKSVSLSGTLTIDDGKYLRVYGDFIVNSTGNFAMGGTNTPSFLGISGNYINNGITNFNKGSVVIAGDLTSNLSSNIQNLGSVVVGGNIVGAFTTNGNGSDQIYVVNIYGNIDITSTKFVEGTNVVAGVQPPSSDTTLIDLVNEFVYGSSCPFVSSTANIFVCSGTNATFSVVFSSSPSTETPTYLWEVNMNNGSGWNSTGVTSATLTLNNVTVAMNSYKYRAKIAWNGCTKNGNYGVLIVNASPTTPSISSVAATCSASGTSTISNYSSSNTYTFTPIGPTAGIGGLVSGMTVGTSYQVTTNNGSCTSASSASFSNAAMLTAPATPAISSTAATCSALGTSTISNYSSSNTYTFTPIGPTAGVGGLVSGMSVGTSYQVTTNNGSCTSASSASFGNAAMLTTPATPAISSTAATCSAAGTSTISNYSSSNTYTFTPTGPTAGVGGLVSGMSVGTSYQVTTNNGSCTSASSASFSNAAMLTLPPAPTFTQTDITQPNCSTSTGSVVLSGLPAGNWTINPGAISGSTTTTTITGLSPSTTYNFTVTTANGCISPASADVVMNLASVTSTWNGSSWSPSAPTSADKIIFNGNFSSTADLVGCSCQVNSGIIVVNSGHTLTLTNEVTVSGGSLTFENNSSLLQINGNANTGNITYKRINTTIRETDYTYWSSPVTAQTLKNLSPQTPSNFFYSFNAAADNWNQESSANVMSIGIGYIIRGPHYPSTPPPGFYEAPFQGVPNNGIVSVPIPFPGKETSNLIGNPYPSALNADLFLTTNSSVLDGTLYFWTHNTAIQLATNITNASAGSGAYAYTSDDYATYNLTGGVSTMIGNKVGGVEQISNKPAGKITSGQAFFATGIAAGNVVFNNSMRVSGGVLGVNNSQFFKFSDSKQKPVSLAEKNRVWLNLTNTQGAFKQMLVGYIPDATNGYDNAFDGESFDGNQFIDFYSINENKNLAIQGRTLPFDENDQVPLGYSSTIKGVFSITIDEVDGLLASQDVFIEDKNTNSVKNLKEGAYSFATETGVFNDRFVLRYVNTNKTLGNSDFEISDNTVLVSNKNKQIKINSSAETMNNIQVYNLLGKSLYQKTNVDANELVISNLGINHQVLLVKIILQNGKTITKKIVY
ncbi:T9SS sorting signal type C domain-containing protein [Flavobacterium sp. LB1P71]|uniref:T9SS sorting signal type C domain-containing protein n=1 Tax=unclassified Flavobacterium TaxID=196869 RepID=UPI003AAB60B6